MAAMLCALALCGPIHGEPARGGLAVTWSRGGEAVAETPIETGRRLAAARGWVREQWVCMARLGSRESGWTVEKWNGGVIGARMRHGGSGAYGVGQALPASKMAAFGADYMTSASTQVRWMIAYITSRYGTPCAALAHSDATGYY